MTQIGLAAENPNPYRASVSYLWGNLMEIMMLTQARLKEVLNYDPETGVFTWKIGRPKAPKGGVAGYLNWKGYWIVCVDRVKYRAHRLAWFYVYGCMPDGQIDHINHEKLDNRISNLRVVSNKVNHRNMGKPSNNTSGVVGVSWFKTRNKWVARIRDGKVYRCLGYFDDFNDAVEARLTAQKRLGYHANHGK